MKTIFVLFARRIDGKGGGMFGLEALGGIGLSAYRDRLDVNPKEE
jgi:hypothetical protein